jgi:cephalosporin-C deacetylase-like acetyl esterase
VGEDGRLPALFITRRVASVLILLLLLPAPGALGDSAPLLPLPAATDTPRAQLLRSLRALAHRQLRARAEALAEVTTGEALQTRRAWVRETILRLIGGLPAARTPLQARVTGRRQGEGFTVENVLYESVPGFPVTANLYLPAAGAGRRPAILASMGHYDLGKAAERWGPDLARQGFVVLAYDPMGQGERLQHYDAELRASRVGGATEEHGQAGARAELAGESLARYFVWDAMRGLDYLASRADVDPDRLGAAGCSGGGTVTTYLAALDDRVKAAAVACYLTSWAALVDGPGAQDAEQSVAGFLSSGLDMADYVALIAPRPVLIVSTEDDFFPVAGAGTVFDEGRRLYALAGVPDRISWSRSPGGHGVTPRGREDVARFFSRWLGGDALAATDLPDARLAPADLAVTATGQVATALAARTVADLIADHAPVPAPGVSLPAAVQELTGVPPGPSGGAPAVTVHRSVPRPGYRLDVVSFPVEEGIVLWGLLAVPEGPGRHPALLMADPRLRSATADAPGADLDESARAGHVVLAVELRGAATLADPAGRPSLLGPLAAAQRLAAVVGRSLAGMRTLDVRRALDVLFAREDVDPARIDAMGRGTFGLPLLQAAVLDARIARVALEATPVSYRAVLDHSLHRDLPEILLPGVLGRYDIGDLIRALAPRPVVIADPVDAVGQSMTASEAGRYLRGIRVVRRRPGASLRWD